MREVGLPLRYGPGRVRNGKAVDARPEPDLVYEAIMDLRRRGKTVYRSGAGHKVDDAIITTQDLLKLYRHLMKEQMGHRQQRLKVGRHRPDPPPGRQRSLFWEE